MRRSIVACVLALLAVVPSAGHGAPAQIWSDRGSAILAVGSPPAPASTGTVMDEDSCGGLAPVDMTCSVSAGMPWPVCSGYLIRVFGGAGTVPPFTGYINVEGPSMPKWTTYWVAGTFVAASAANPEPVPCGSLVTFDAIAVGAGYWSVTLTTS